MVETAKIREPAPGFDVPVRYYEHGHLTVEGFSRAAYQTYWRIPELRIGFDLGAQPQIFTKTPVWALSHTHADHVAGLPSYLARRDILGMAPPDILLPAEKIDAIRDLLRAWVRLQEWEIPCNLVGLAPGGEYKLNSQHTLTAFRTDHSIVSLGYIVYSVRHKLKPDLLREPASTIEQLRRSGQPVYDTTRIPLVAYLGDTRASGLDNHPDVYRAKILITESTFLRPDRNDGKIGEYGHTHIREIGERAGRFENERIILGHFSGQYSPENIRAFVEEHLPASLLERVVLWI